MEQLEHWTGYGVRMLLAGLWMVLLALGLRLAAATGSGAAPLGTSQVVTILSECLTPQQVRAETASEKFTQPEKPPRDVEPPVAAPLTFSPQEAEAIAIGGTAEADVDAASLLTAPLQLATVDGPQVLIVHTHTTEAYTPTDGCDYTPTDPYRTLDQACNVTRVGQEVAAALEDAGIGVIHDTAVHDDPVYQGAYERSFDCIEQQLAEHPSIQVILDIHRDAAEADGGAALRKCAVVEGETCAQLMLVVGTDEGGLSHPRWRENLGFALKLQALLERDSPGICRTLSLRKERFNQHFTPCSVLVEVGASGNTLAEALTSARHLAKALTELIEASQ